MAKMIRFQMIKSLHGRTVQQQSCVKGLGLKKIGQISEIEDTPAVRGMYEKVSFMVKKLEDK